MSETPEDRSVDPDLVAEETALRGALSQTEAPSDLETRLLEIPDSTAPVLPTSWWGRIAAAALVLVAVSVSVVHLTSSPPVSPLEALVRQAAADHMHDRHVTVETSNADDLEVALEAQLSFDIAVPDLGDALALVGGRRCALAEHPVAYSLWRGEAGAGSLFEFRASDHQLPADLEQHEILISEFEGADAALPALIWIDAGHGYVLVVDDRRLLPEYSK